MMHVIFEPIKMASQDTVSYIKTVAAATDLDNGNLVVETVPSINIFGKKDLNCFVGEAASDVANQVILIIDSSEVALIDGEYRVDVVDPRKVYIPAERATKARQLVVGDMFAISANGFATTPTVGEFASGDNSSLLFAPQATQIGGRMICEVIDNHTFSVGKKSVAGYILKVTNA